MSSSTRTSLLSSLHSRTALHHLSKASIKWGIIGLGDVCKQKSGPAFYKCEGSELVAVMRRSPGKAQEYAAKVPGGECVGYESIDKFLRHPGLDAVYVSTRPGTHLQICQQVAQAGKACYVEKPVGRCAKETEQIIKVFEDANLPLYTAYISRAYERTQYVKKLILDKVIGEELINVTYNLKGSGGARDMEGDLPWRLDVEQSGGGLIMDVGCHVIDRIDYLCGPLINVKGEARRKKNKNHHRAVEDFVKMTAEICDVDYPSGLTTLPRKKKAIVECTWDFASGEESFDELKIIGSNAYIKMAAMGFSPVEVHDLDGQLISCKSFDAPDHTAQDMIQAVTNDLLGEVEEDFISKGNNALRTSRVLDTILESYYGGREVGFWSNENVI